MGNRFWISTYHEAADKSHNYTFCCDTKEGKSWQGTGLKDDFYQTGIIKHMEPIDPYCRSYCFHEAATLFIVKLKA